LVADDLGEEREISNPEQKYVLPQYPESAAREHIQADIWVQVQVEEHLVRSMKVLRCWFFDTKYYPLFDSKKYNTEFTNSIEKALRAWHGSDIPQSGNWNVYVLFRTIPTKGRDAGGTEPYTLHYFLVRGLQADAVFGDSKDATQDRIAVLYSYPWPQTGPER
jgi:hypothetical protein